MKWQEVFLAFTEMIRYRNTTRPVKKNCAHKNEKRTENLSCFDGIENKISVSVEHENLASVIKERLLGRSKEREIL